jgi:hypothetical protein
MAIPCAHKLRGTLCDEATARGAPWRVFWGDVGAMADGATPWREAGEGQAAPVGRAARAWERAAAVESRGARDPDGGLAFHWAAHSWRRCAAACEHGSPSAAVDAPDQSSDRADGVAAAWDAVAAAWEAAAAAWLAVATAQRHLDASRAAEDRTDVAGGVAHDDIPSGDVVGERAAAVAAARRLADERVRAAERCERDASPSTA